MRSGCCETGLGFPAGSGGWFLPTLIGKIILGVWRWLWACSFSSWAPHLDMQGLTAPSFSWTQENLLSHLQFFPCQGWYQGLFWIICAKMKTPPPPWFRILVDLTCLWPWQRHSWAPLQLVPVLCWRGQCSQSHLPAVLQGEPIACVSQQVTWCWHLVNPDGHQSVFGIFKPTIVGYHIGADMFGAKSQTGDVCHLGMTG